MNAALLAILIFGIAIAVAPFYFLQGKTDERQLRESFLYNYGGMILLIGIAFVIISVM